MKRRIFPLPAALGAVAAFVFIRWGLAVSGYSPSAWIAILVSPVLEEWLYRGVLFWSLRKEVSEPIAIIASAGLFALGHQRLLSMLLAFLFGIAAAYVMKRTDKLVFPILLHIGWNLAVFFLNP